MVDFNKNSFLLFFIPKNVFLFQLMKHVRLPLISREFLMTHVDTEVLVRENAECKELLLEGMYHLNFPLTYMNYDKNCGF